jgi:hypothetical protein
MFIISALIERINFIAKSKATVICNYAQYDCCLLYKPDYGTMVNAYMAYLPLRQSDVESAKVYPTRCIEIVL